MQLKHINTKLYDIIYDISSTEMNIKSRVGHNRQGKWQPLLLDSGMQTIDCQQSA